MTDQNIARTCRIFVPPHYQTGTAYPLVMAFHGWGGDENEFLGGQECHDPGGRARIHRTIALLIGLPHRGYLEIRGKAGNIPVLLITGTHEFGWAWKLVRDYFDAQS